MTPRGPSKQARAAFPGLVAFFTASVVSGLVASAATLAWLGMDDPGAAGLPEVAFQAAFIGLVFVSATGTAILGAGGAAYPVLLMLAGLGFELFLARRSLAFVVLGWLLLAGLPLLLAWFIARRAR